MSPHFALTRTADGLPHLPRQPRLRRRTFHPIASSGFTLVELLVVMSIIAIMIAMLLPVLSKARQAADDVLCLSNLRQISVGWHMYTEENRGMIVRARAATRDDDYPGWQAGWGNGSHGVPFTYYLQQYLGTYAYDNALPGDPLNTAAVYWCPTNRKKGVISTLARQRPGNYGANPEYADIERPLPRNLRLADIPDHQAERPIIYDGIIDWTNVVEIKDPVAYRLSANMNPVTSLHRWAHQGTMNLIWMDLHASRNGPDTLSTGLFDHYSYGGWDRGKAAGSFTW